MSEPMRPTTCLYGWRDFDPEVVEGLAENDSRFIDRRSNGWIACPLRGHFDDRLPWRDDNYRKGSVPAGDPPASFRAAPTYVLESPLDNVIAGRELIADAVAGSWEHTRATRLGNENSEGALAWNAFRSLQEAGGLGVASRALAGIDAAAEPELYFWERRIETSRAEPWLALTQLRTELEPDRALQAGPDACLRLPGWGWVLIDVRFGSGADILDDPARVEAWLERYASGCPGLFDEEAIRRARLRDFPHDLLRTMALAHHLKADGELAVVVALVRESELTGSERLVGRCLAETADVAFRRVTWESLYRALDPDEPKLAPLRRYLENKSYGLRPAFALLDDADESAQATRSAQSP